MTFIIKRDTEQPLYIGGYEEATGGLIISNTPKGFEDKSHAVEVAKALNLVAHLSDSAYRYEVYEVTEKKVKTNVLMEGGKDSAYNKRLNPPAVEHEVEIEE